MTRQWNDQTANDANWWTCRLCQGWTRKPKQKCYTCGANQKYASMSCTLPPLVRAADQRLANTTSLVVDSPQAIASSNVAGNSSSRNELVQQLKEAEDSLATIPPAMTKVRAQMESEIVNIKKLITETNPVGVRLENCRGAVDRALKRKDSAIEEHNQSKLRLAEAESAYLAKVREMEVLELEALAELAKTQQKPNSLVRLQEGMGAVITEMKNGGVLPEESIRESEILMTQLFQGFTLLSQQATATVAKTSVLEMLQAHKPHTPVAAAAPQNLLPQLNAGTDMGTAGVDANHMATVAPTQVDQDMSPPKNEQATATLDGG